MNSFLNIYGENNLKPICQDNDFSDPGFFRHFFKILISP